MKAKLFLIALIAVQGLFTNINAQERVLLSKGTVHIGNGRVINQGLIGIEGDKIVLVENALAYTLDQTKWDTIIDLKGLDIYPGFIAPNTQLGLTEIDAVRATRDHKEVGFFNPHVRSLIAYNAESEVSKTVRTNGVFYTQATPTGGTITGSSSIMGLKGWNWEDAVLKKDDGIHLKWPSATSGGAWWQSAKPKNRNKKYSEQLKKIRDFFQAAYAYNNSKDLFDQRFEAMRGIFEGNKRLYIHTDEMRAMIDVIEFKKDLEITHPVIVGGYEAHQVAEQLNTAEIPVIIRGGHTLPMNEDDPVDLPYRLPYMLKEAGVLFCIQNSGRMETMNNRNLPFLAGTAKAYGLMEEEAISAISLNAAKILGIEEMAGSIEVGKQATLFVNEGSPLDMRTNNLLLGMINGEFINLSNIQVELYEKYKKKYEQAK